MTSKEFFEDHPTVHPFNRVYRFTRIKAAIPYIKVTRPVHDLLFRILVLFRELRIGTTMMAVRCYLLFVVVVVAALMHHVSGTTLVRSSNGGRIKGATTANDSERHLQVDTERKTKKHAGNILLTLDQVVSSIDITFAVF